MKDALRKWGLSVLVCWLVVGTVAVADTPAAPGHTPHKHTDQAETDQVRGAQDTIRQNSNTIRQFDVRYGGVPFAASTRVQGRCYFGLWGDLTDPQIRDRQTWVCPREDVDSYCRIALDAERRNDNAVSLNRVIVGVVPDGKATVYYEVPFGSLITCAVD